MDGEEIMEYAGYDLEWFVKYMLALKDKDEEMFNNIVGRLACE